MATCDGERFLGEQLASIAAQTALPHELIVSDDASTDSTPSIVARFARDAPFRVSLHRNEQRLGVGENFMRAARLCGGELLAFADQDDVWGPEKLERCAATLDEPGVHLCVHACSVVDEGLEPLGAIVPKIRRSRAVPGLEVPKWAEAPGMGMVFERSLLDLALWERRPRAHHSHGRLLHDEWVLGLARLSGRISFLAEPLCLYRQHDVNIEGAPSKGVGTRFSHAASIGAAYYARRAVQARDWAELLRGGQFAAEGESWARLAAALEWRARVHDRGRGRVSRAAELVGAARNGAYRSRRREGFGIRALVRDAAFVAAR